MPYDEPEQMQDAIDRLTMMCGVSNDGNFHPRLEPDHSRAYGIDVANFALDECLAYRDDELKKFYLQNLGDGVHHFNKFALELDAKYPSFYGEQVQGLKWGQIFIDWCFIKIYGLERAKEMLYLNRKSKLISTPYTIEGAFNNYTANGKISKEPNIGGLVYIKEPETKVYQRVGIIYKINAKYIYTVEADVADTIIQNQYLISNPWIAGYACPKYFVNEDPDSIVIHITPRLKNWDMLIVPGTGSVIPDDIKEPDTRMNQFIFEANTFTEDGFYVDPIDIQNGGLPSSSGNDELEPIPPSIGLTTSNPGICLGIWNPIIDDIVSVGNSYKIDPMTTENIYFPNGTYDVTVSNKLGIKKIIGATMLYDKYANIYFNLLDFDGMNTTVRMVEDPNGSSGGDSENSSGETPMIEQDDSFDTLSIMDCNTIGNIESLASDTMIKNLILSGSNVAGDIKDLNSIEKLEVIDFHNTRVDGDIKSLDSLENLKDFNINCTGVGGDIGDVHALENLEFFDINDTNLHGDLSDIRRNMPKLVEIWLSADTTAGIKGNISGLAGMGSLQRIHLSGQGITGDIAVLGSFTKLQRAHFANCNVEGEFETILHAEFIPEPSSGGDNDDESGAGESYVLSDVEFINIPTLNGKTAGIGVLKDMTHLCLNGVGVIARLIDFAELTNMKNLELIDIDLTGSLTHISGLSQLETLTLSQTFAGHKYMPTREMLKRGVLQPLSDTVKVSAADYYKETEDPQKDNEIEPSSSDIGILSGMGNLEYLSIHSLPFISGDIMTAIRSLGKLQNLRIADCPKLSGNISAISGLGELKNLWLSGCHITGDVSSITRIDLFKLGLNDIDAYGNMSCFRNMENLEGVTLFCDRIRGDFGQIAGNLPYLEFYNTGKPTKDIL